MTFKIRPFEPVDADQVVELWTNVSLTRPWNDPQSDISQAYETWPNHFLVAIDPSGQLVGTVMSGYDGHRGWLYYLAVAPDAQGAGIGRALVAKAEERLQAVGCVKVQLMVRSENTQVLRFYDSLGYETSDVVVAGKRIDA